MDDKGKYAIEPGMLGFVNSCYQLGSIFAVPFAPWFAQKYGRRWSIMLGSLIMVVGALIQGFAQHGKAFGLECSSVTDIFQLACTSLLV